MVVDGLIVGTWERKSGRGKEIVKTMLFVTLSEDLKTELKEEGRKVPGKRGNP